MRRIYTNLLLVLVVGGIAGGCVSMSFPSPQEVRIPEPVRGNSGKYMCPFTSDDTVAEWVETGMAARFGSAVGSTAGAYVGAKACEQIPFVGGFIGSKVGDAAGRAISIKAAGGWDKIK